MQIFPDSRSSVIEKAINIESQLSALITFHFFPGPALTWRFFHGVMGDEYANNAFKVSVFSKCYPSVPQKTLQSLRRLFSIRNTFAHCGSIVSFTGSDAGIANPRKTMETLNVQSLVDEFNLLNSEVLLVLISLIKTLGVMEPCAPPFGLPSDAGNEHAP